MSENVYELGEVTFYLVNVHTGTVERVQGFRLPGKPSETRKCYFRIGETAIYSEAPTYGKAAFGTKEEVMAYLERWVVTRRKELGEVYRWLESEAGRP